MFVFENATTPTGENPASPSSPGDGSVVPPEGSSVEPADASTAASSPVPVDAPVAPVDAPLAASLPLAPASSTSPTSTVEQHAHHTPTALHALAHDPPTRRPPPRFAALRGGSSIVETLGDFARHVKRRALVRRTPATIGRVLNLVE